MLYVTAKRKSQLRKRNELEDLYLLFCGNLQCEPTEEGRRQFYNAETFGEFPTDPDPFYIRLSQGKKSFTIVQESIRETYSTSEWCGWYQYWLDWKGNRWVLKHLMLWHDNPPEWLFSEDETEDGEPPLLIKEEKYG